MKILVTGATGFIGKALVSHLLQKGHELVALSRHPGQAREKLPGVQVIAGDLENAQPDLTRAGPIDAVIHLAGEGIAAERWTPARKQHILKSREAGTHNLAEALLKAKAQPRVVISASAVGFYGDRGDEKLDEASSTGRGFLAEVCRRWETAAQEIPGQRRVILRLGMVLDHGGGALAKMLPAFRVGLGGPLGSGKQWTSWIHRADLIRMIDLALDDRRWDGGFNAVAPHPVTNRVFTRTLGSVLKRPTWVPVPRTALRILFGEMADEALLASSRVEPERLNRLGYTWSFPSLEGALSASIEP